MNTKQKGDISEGHVLALFLKHGFTVLMPFGDRSRYDFVVEHGDKFVRIQVKTGRIEGPSVVFSAASVTTENGRWKSVQYTGQIEYFAVYCPDTTKTYIVPVSKCRTKETRLSLTGKSRNQHDVLSASDFEWPGSLVFKARAR